MWWNVERIFTLWASIGKRRDCTPKNVAKIQVIFFAILLCSSFLLFSFSPTTAEAEVLVFTGTWPEEGGQYVDVPFTLSNHAVVDITYNAACGNVLATKFYLRTGDLTDINDLPYFDNYNIAISDDEEPLEGYPLNKGDYIARIVCNYSVDTYDPNWQFWVETSPINLSFAPEDQEPPSMVPVALTNSTSFSGWLGLWGTPDDPVFTQDNTTGHDISDYKLYSLKKGTKIKFRASWESFTASTGWQSPAMNAQIVLYRDGHTYFVTNFDLLENSGDETREITLLEDGVYKISAVNVSYSDPKQYRAYKMDVIINGEIFPPPGLFLTFQEATWVKQPANRVGDYSYNLVIKYNIKNTYNESKTIQHSADVTVPVITAIPNDFYAGLTSGIMDAIENSSCATDTTDWSGFCHQQGDICVYDVYVGDFPSSSIPALGNVEYAESIPVTLADYRNFDDSLQIVRLQISAVGESTKCFTHGLYFWPGWAIAPLPGIRSLLLNGKGN